MRVICRASKWTEITVFIYYSKVFRRVQLRRPKFSQHFQLKTKRSFQEVCVLLFHFVSDTIFGQIRRYLWRYLSELLTRGGCTNEYLFLLGLSLKVKLMSLIFKYGIFQMGAVVKKKKTCFPSLARIHNFTDDNCGWLCVIPMLWLRTLTSFSFY